MRRWLSFVGLFALVGAAACSAGKNGGSAHGGSAGAGAGGGDAGQGAGADTGTTNTGMGGDAGAGGLFATGGGPAGSGGGVPNCDSGPNDDKDMDGFTPMQGDCNDCDANVNPGAVEVLTKMGGGSSSGSGGADMGGVPVDENCNGLIDDKDPDIMPCDANLPLTGDAMAGAKAIDICHVASKPKEWGILEAKWVLADGAPPPGNPNFDLGHGIMPAFGPNVKVQKGQRLLGVSGGSARQPTDPDYHPVSGFDKGYTCNHPMGFPKESPTCGVAVTGQCHDSTGLQVKVRVPTNAHGFSFNFNFFTFEWPVFVCSTYNDFFAAILSPIPKGLPDGNITFDNLGNPVSVNNAFMQVCACAGGPPCTAGGKQFSCALGDLGLFGTGFGADLAGSDHASTGWLVTTAPVDPGVEMTLRFVAYDSGDGVLDSTGLVDNFSWIAEPGTPVGTNPIPDPK
jgi:hypothetical protein